VGDDLLMNSVRLDGTANFTYAQIGHDFQASGGSFRTFQAFGMNVGGSLLLDHARFRTNYTIVSFAEVSVGMDFKGRFTRFEDTNAPVDFGGLTVNGFVDLQRAQFKGPASFILAHIKGDFDAPGATFEDARDFTSLESLGKRAGYNSTFNADFGSMQVDGFAVFENVLFDRSVSFRNAHFSNLYLDGTHWPDINVLMSYTNSEPTSNNLLRLEAVDFTAIRDISSSQFRHTKAQLKESESNLVTMFGNLSPYSFDTYDKLENFFQREGAPGLADEVFINAKQREGADATHWRARLLNKLLFLTVGYGRQPSKAFWESLGVVIGYGVFYCFFMKSQNAHHQHKTKTRGKKPPHHRKSYTRAAFARLFSRRFPLALFFSLGTFLPIIDLGAKDIFDVKSHKAWIRYLIAFEQILGFILVPLWTIALSGLIK
jgi:hypothetical protein